MAETGVKSSEPCAFWTLMTIAKLVPAVLCASTSRCYQPYYRIRPTLPLGSVPGAATAVPPVRPQTAELQS
jgi:hypothetical protein